MSSLPGITRQDEEKRLQHTLEIAQRKVDANRQSVQALAEELHAMPVSYTHLRSHETVLDIVCRLMVLIP